MRRSFIVLSAAFSLAMVLLVAFSVVALHGLSGARAYVHGESQWTKAQKQAVIALFDYAVTGKEQRFGAFERALSVNHGDRRARIALSEDPPDYETAREGFIAGRNRPEDVGLMMTLFVTGRELPLFKEAIEAWAEGDADIARLEEAAAELRRRVRAHGAGSPEVVGQLEVIQRIDQELTRHEDRFSHVMGQLSHLLTNVFSITVIAAALAMIVGASFLAWRLLRISEQKESALMESEQRYRALVDQPEVGMWQIDPAGRIAFLNPAMRVLLGLRDDEDVEGEFIDQFVEESQRTRVRENRAARADGRDEAMEVELVPRRGAPKITLVHGAPIRVASSIVGHVGTCVDISGRKAAERELRHAALHDGLTGLPNRKLFLDRLDMALRRTRRSGKDVAILFIDLDRFKLVNDGLGHAAGDELLRDAARRLESQIREGDSIARFGGDEFGVIVEQIESVRDAIEPARRIVRAFEAAFEIDGISARIGASIGIAVSSDGRLQPDELVRHADIAMYVVKTQGGGGVHIYDAEQDETRQTRLVLESALWKAVEHEELRLLYQPIVDLATGQVESMEALLRWEHPERGLLAPDQFIPLAEESGAIVPLGEWVVRQACEDFRLAGARLGSSAPKAVAVNVSDAEFRLGDPARSLAEASRACDLPASAIRIEVTESMLTEQPGALRNLRSRGHDIVIDDFGTGYASLDRLRHVPFNSIKIDRSFVAGFQDSIVDISIIEAIAHVGRKLGVRVVAEGIEEPEQIPQLIELGCGFGQGYHYARPIPLEEIIAMIEDRSSK